jgi:prophage DNA circulation protein
VSVYDRLRSMRYISPSGSEFALEFDELTRIGGKKAPVSEYPSQDEGSVQDLGEITQEFPVTCYISGVDYDLEADRFVDALAEPGVGLLMHPRWGDLPVVPVSRSQSENFIDGAGRAVFTITFIHAKNNSFDFPSISDAANLQTLAEAEALDAAVIAEFAEETITDPHGLAGLANAVQNTISNVRTAFANLTNKVEGLKTIIEDALNDIERNSDSLVAAPAQLLAAFIDLYGLIADVDASPEEKLEGYVNLFLVMASIALEQSIGYGDLLGLVSAGQITAIINAASRSTVTGSITTRGEAARIIEQLNALSTDAAATLESMEDVGGYAVPYELNRQRNLVVTTAITSLVDRSLNLPMERTIVLSEDKTPLVVCWEQYGGIDRLEEFIQFNRLADDEILLIPAGREVVVYE